MAANFGEFFCELDRIQRNPPSELMKMETELNPRAFITGVTGQDGSYLAELLLEKGYEVHGLVRRCSTSNTRNIDPLLHDSSLFEKRFFLHKGDITDGQSLARLILDLEPDEIYNLAAQSHVRVSFDQPAYTLVSTGLGALHVLEAARQLDAHKSVRVFQASSSEMFGEVTESPQRESTPFRPRSPYACAKVYAYYQAVNYRQSYDLFAANGILFNHESPRRGEEFVTRKITRAAARIKLGLQHSLSLGNLDSSRDWGFAGEYVEAMWRILQHHEPGDFVIATGKSYSIRDFLCHVFEQLDLEWQQFVTIDDRLLRPAEVNALVGDAAKARNVLNWEPQVSVEDLVRIMLEHDLALARQEVNVSPALKPSEASQL